MFGIREEYALRALVELARRPQGRPAQSHDLAHSQGIPAPYLDQILLQLRRAGIVRSIRGVAGGFLLARPAEEVTAADVLRALRGSTAVYKLPQEEGAPPASSVSELWERLQAGADAILNDTTLRDLAERQEALDQGRVPMFYI